MSAQDNLSPQQFFHGTDAELSPGDMIAPGRKVVHVGTRPGKVYFTDKYETADTFGRGAAERHATSYDASARTWVHGEAGAHYVYQVEPTGPHTKDPILPDNAGSYESAHPLRILKREDR